MTDANTSGSIHQMTVNSDEQQLLWAMRRARTRGDVPQNIARRLRTLIECDLDSPYGQWLAKRGMRLKEAHDD